MRYLLRISLTAATVLILSGCSRTQTVRTVANGDDERNAHTPVRCPQCRTRSALQKFTPGAAQSAKICPACKKSVPLQLLLRQIDRQRNVGK